MFVAPKPDHRPLDTSVPQLLRRLLVLVLKARIVLVVRDDNQTTSVLIRFDYVRYPVDQAIHQLAIPADTRNVIDQWNIRNEWYAYRIITSVDCDDSPILVLETKKARLLS